MPDNHPPAPAADGRRHRVAFVLQHFDGGGMERVVLNLLRHLDRGEFQPILVLFDRYGSLLDQVPPDVPIHDLGSRQARRQLMPLARLFTAIRPDVVYTGTNSVAQVCLAAAALRRGWPPVVIGEHTPLKAFLADAKMPRLRLALMRRLYPQAAAIAAPAIELGEELRTILGLPRLPIVAVPNPVIEQSPPLPALPEPPPGPAFLAVGRLNPEKNFDLLLRAFALVLSRHPHARLTICGEGPERDALGAQAGRLGIAHAVDMPGFVADPIRRLGRGRILVMSSWREGFPNVLVEALAEGMPIVSTDCPIGPRLVLLHGRHGLLVPNGDAAALAEGMARLVEDTALAQSLRQGGPDRAAPFEVRAASRAFARLFRDVALNGSVTEAPEPGRTATAST